MPAARTPVVLVVGAGILFGTAGTAQALGPKGSTPLGVGISRIVVGALALMLAMPLLGASPRRLVPLWRTPAMLVTACTAGAYPLFFFAGVSRAGVALGTLVAVGSAPLFAGLVGWAALRHRPTLGWLGATLVCIVGLGLLTAPGLSAGSALGFLLALGAPASRVPPPGAAQPHAARPRASRPPGLPPPGLPLHVPAPPGLPLPGLPPPGICSHSTDLLPSGWEQIGQVGADPGAEW
ncbi:MAG TPA: EamA family transporter [Motilibacterales bacterium]|nr:EamA family transporter [Motilibacterales bacterium]